MYTHYVCMCCYNNYTGVFGAESSQLSSVASSSFLSGSGYTSDNYSDSDDGSEQTDC